MKKTGVLAMAAAMMGLASAAQSANKSAEDLGQKHENFNKQHFYPDYGISPKQYGMFIATKQSNIIKRKRRSKLAFG